MSKWRPVDAAARKGGFVYVRRDGLPDCVSQWGKVSHIAIYGWLDMSSDDPEDVSLLRPQPTEWMPLSEYPAP
jgi:hypothetical protein